MSDNLTLVGGKNTEEVVWDEDLTDSNKKSDTLQVKIEKKVEEKIDKREIPEKDKDLVSIMRSLLTNYPLNIKFSENKDYLSLAQNISTIIDILNFCKYKTNSEDVKNKIKAELKEFDDDLKFKEISILFYEYLSYDIEYNKDAIFIKLKNLINSNLNIITEKVQLYLLAIPNRGKRNMHLSTSHGLPGAEAEEYEAAEIKEGQKVSSGNPFTINEEGQVEIYQP